MRTISKDKLRKIIQEELEKELVDEGFLDTFKELGSDAKKWYQDAAKRGTVKAGDRETRRVGHRTARYLQKELQKLIKACGPDGGKCSQEAKSQMKNLKSTIQAFKQNPGVAVATMTDASDGDMDAKPGSDIAKMFKHLDKADAVFAAAEARAGKKTASEPREPSAGSAGAEVSKSSSKDDIPSEEESKSEISSGDLLAALNQLENVGNFSPKRFIATLEKYKKSSTGGLNAYVDTANLGKSGQYGASLSNSDKQVLSRLNKSFKGQALAPIAKAFDNAIGYIKNLYGKAGADARLKEAKRRPYLTEGAKNILMICAESITENPRTGLEKGFDKRRAAIQARLMKRWNYNF